MNPLEEMAPEDVGRTYREKPFWKKSIVVLAGVGMNFLIAYLMFFGVLVAEGVSQLSTTIEEVVATFDDGRPTPRRCAGLLPGDRVVAVDGQPTPDGTAVSAALGSRPGETIDLTIERGDIEEILTVTLASRVNPETGADHRLSGSGTGDRRTAGRGLWRQRHSPAGNCRCRCPPRSRCWDGSSIPTLWLDWPGPWSATPTYPTTSGRSVRSVSSTSAARSMI